MIIEAMDSLRGRLMRARGRLAYTQRGTAKIAASVGVKKHTLQRFLRGENIYYDDIDKIERWCLHVLSAPEKPAQR